MLDRLCHVHDTDIGEQSAALQKGKISAEITRALTGHALHRSRIDAELQGLGDLEGNLVLHFEDVGRLPIETHRPDVRTGLVSISWVVTRIREPSLCRLPSSR